MAGALLVANEHPETVRILLSLINSASGKNHAAKLLNWAIDILGTTIPSDIRLTWQSLHQQMCSTVMMIEQQFSPMLITPSIDQMITFICEQGGIDKLHRAFMAMRRQMAQKQKSHDEELRETAARFLLEQESRRYGQTVEEYILLQKQQSDDKRRQRAKQRAEQVSRYLIDNGTLIEDMKPAWRLSISDANGQDYLLSVIDEDRFWDGYIV